MTLLSFVAISVLVLSLIKNSTSFIPASLEVDVIEKLDYNSRQIIGEVSETLSHERILSRGVLRSVAMFFHDQPGGSTRINLTAIEAGYYDKSIETLYYAYYRKWFCKIDLYELLETELGNAVALPDFELNTRRLPFAHFDGEAFLGSNQRVINFTTNVYKALADKNYFLARSLAGEIMHTIHDFYSHSNW